MSGGPHAKHSDFETPNTNQTHQQRNNKAKYRPGEAQSPGAHPTVRQQGNGTATDEAIDEDHETVSPRKETSGFP